MFFLEEASWWGHLTIDLPKLFIRGLMQTFIDKIMKERKEDIFKRIKNSGNEWNYGNVWQFKANLTFGWL